MTLPSFDGVNPRSGLQQRLLDRLDRGRVEGLDRQHPRLGNVDRGQLLERRLLAVVVDLHAVEEGRGGAPGADGVELRPRVLDARVHAVLGVLNELVDGGHQRSSFAGVEMIVPMRSPAITRRMFPSARARDVDRQIVVHAERQRSGVHDLEATLDRFSMRELGEKLGVRVDARVVPIDPARAVLGHQDRVCVDLECPKGRGRVGGEERVARAGREE